MSKHIVTSRPDPFTTPGYLGVIETGPDRDQFGRDQARYAFANGFGAGVLFDGPFSCLTCQDDAHPYELHALHGAQGGDPVLCERYIGHVCGIDAAGVRHWLGEIAALPADAACDHGRSN